MNAMNASNSMMYPIYLDNHLYNLSINNDESIHSYDIILLQTFFFIINFKTSYEIDTIMTCNYNFLVKLVTCHATEFISAK